MKKVLTLALAMVLTFSMGTTAFAAETQITETGTQSANTTVTYGPEEGYTIIIPDSVVIDAETDKGNAKISAENIIIDFGKTLNIRITGDDYTNSWELIDTADISNKIEYTIGTAAGLDDIKNTDVVLTADAGAHWDDKVENELHFTIAEDAKTAGEYEDTLTFTVSID